MLPYNPEYVFTATRSFALNGREYVAGEVIDKTGISRLRLQQLYALRRIAPVTSSIFVETSAPVVTEPGEPIGGFMEPEPGEVTIPLSLESVSLSARRRVRSV